METAGVKLFIVYARSDADLKDRLLRHLEPLRLRGLISTWHDADIDGGSEWETAIEENMAASRMILLLISPDFMASSYIQSKELIEALHRHEQGTACVIPIFLRPALWEAANFAKLQGFPQNGQAVESSSAKTVDEALLEVARGINRAILSLSEPEPSAPTDTGVGSTETAHAADQSGRPARRGEVQPLLARLESEFQQSRAGVPLFRMIGYPATLDSDSVDIESADLRRLLVDPPEIRPLGWNMNLRTRTLDYWRDGVEIDAVSAKLRLTTHGILEFRQVLDRFRHREREDEFTAGPRLYPYPVVEYPLSFLALYKEIASSQTLHGPFTFEMQYWGIEGWYLPPYLPRQVGFSFAETLVPYQEQDFSIHTTVPSRDFDAGEVAAALLRPFYRCFSYGPDAIPTYEPATRRIAFDLATGN